MDGCFNILFFGPKLSLGNCILTGEWDALLAFCSFCCDKASARKRASERRMFLVSRVVGTFFYGLFPSVFHREVTAGWFPVKRWLKASYSSRTREKRNLMKRFSVAISWSCLVPMRCSQHTNHPEYLLDFVKSSRYWYCLFCSLRNQTDFIYPVLLHASAASFFVDFLFVSEWIIILLFLRFASLVSEIASVE